MTAVTVATTLHRSRTSGTNVTTWARRGSRRRGPHAAGRAAHISRGWSATRGPAYPLADRPRAVADPGIRL